VTAAANRVRFLVMVGAVSGPQRVSTFIVRALVEVVERAGVKRDALMGAAGLELDRLEDIATGFTFSELVALEEKALDLTRDEGLGLRLAEQSSEAAFDVVAHLATHAPTLRDAVALCTQFQRLLMDGTAVTLTERAEAAVVRVEFPRSTLRADRMLAEFAIGGFVRMIRSFTVHDVVLRAVSFEHPRPAHARAYTRVFGGAERFSQPLTGVEIDRELLDRRQLHHHPELHSVLHREAANKLERLSSGSESAADRIKQYLMSVPPKRMPDMDGVARALGISARSLRRRLADEGVSYKAIVQSVLETRAEQMLSDPNRSIQETANEMGFSDPSAFQRAFKRWKGMTPGQFKESKG
jgi:AraC-like DNA-binding protein